MLKIGGAKGKQNFSKYEIEAIKAGMAKKIDILGKWFSPENDQEKDLFAKMKQKEKRKEENSD